MPASRGWMVASRVATVLVVASIGVLVGSCGDGGDSITPPPEERAVVSVEVAPTAATIEVGQTASFSATPRDADGASMGGQAVTWSSSATAVATVSGSGVATGVGAGTATITASSGGRSGTAQVTVTVPVDPDVVATGTIGSSGGSLGNDDVGISIAAGELSSATELEIHSADEAIDAFGDDAVTPRYRLSGLPADREVEVRVRVRATGELRDGSYIGLGVPVVASSIDVLDDQPGLIMREAMDSSGYLVATLPVRGGGSAGAATPVSAAGPADPRPRASGVDALMDGLFGGVTGVHTDTVPGGHFVIVSWGAPWSELQPKVSRAAKLLGDAWTTLEGQGYTMSHRTQWPIEVRVRPLDAYGAFVQRTPWPLDVNTGYFKLGIWAFDQPDMPGTAIHEFYHFVQARYTGSMGRNQAAPYGWVKEAGSTWMEEKAPETIGVFRNAFFQGQRADLFTGLYPSLDASDGYGKAPIMKYIADRWGTARVRSIFESVGNGTPAVDAVLQAIPEAADEWWPDLLTQYMKGEIISLAPADLPPPMGELPLRAGVSSWSRQNDLHTLGAQFIPFKPDPADFGTGTTLSIRLPDEQHADGWKILPFRLDGSGSWEEQGGVTDTLVIEGEDLRLGRRYGVFIVHTAPTAPYTKTWSNKFVTDLGYVDGDWLARDVAVVDDAIEYTGADDDTGLVDVADVVGSSFEALASGGVWTRTEADENRYVWKPTAEFAGDLAAFHASASSEARVRPSKDSLYLEAIIEVAPPATDGDQAPDTAALGGIALLLLLAGVALRRERRGVAMIAIVGVGLVAWGCEISPIRYSWKFRYELRFANPTLTASATDETVPLVQLSNGTGTVFVDNYEIEWWDYIRDEDDVVVDSVARTVTASGQTTVSLGAELLKDGVVTTDDEGLQRSAARLGTASARLRRAVGLP